MKTNRFDGRGFLLYDQLQRVAPLASRLPIGHGAVMPDDATDISICWMTKPLTNQNPPRLKWLNHPLVVSQLDKSDFISTSLNANSLDYMNQRMEGSVATGKLFTVPVFNLEALAVFERGRRVNRNLWRSLCELAVKAVHSLQLDFALVTLWLRERGQAAVFGVDAAPRVNEELGVLYAEAILRYLERDRRSRTRRLPLIGADIEMLLITPNGKISPASHYVSRRGTVGYDAYRIRRTKTVHPILEFRPKPSADPQKLLESLMQTMRLAARKINRRSLRWMAGAMPVGNLSLGGHLHVSRCWLNSHLLRILDHYLTLPFMMCESVQAVRRRGKYGRLGDFRRKKHGGFEYRVLASWIVDPWLASGVIGLFYVLVRCQHELDRPNQVMGLGHDWQRAYYSGDKQQLLPLVRATWAQIEQLSLYPRFRAMIEPFRRQSIGMKPWNEAADIRPRWNL